MNNQKRWPVQLFDFLLESGRTTNLGEFLPAETASVSQTTRARSGFRPAARRPPYIPAAWNPFAAVTPPGTWALQQTHMFSVFWYSSIIASNHNQQQPELISQTDWKSTNSLHRNCVRKEPYLLPWALWKQNRWCRDELARSHCFSVRVRAHHG